MSRISLYAHLVLDGTDFVAQENRSIAIKLQSEASIGQGEAKYQFNLKSNKVLEIR